MRLRMTLQIKKTLNLKKVKVGWSLESHHQVLLIRMMGLVHLIIGASKLLWGMQIKMLL